MNECYDKKQFPTTIVTLSVHGDRIYVGDQCEAFHLATYKRSEKTLHVFADCTTPRYLTATCLLDYDTMAGADKFGNIFVARLPPDVSSKIEKDPKGGKAIIQSGTSLTGAPYKVCSTYIFCLQHKWTYTQCGAVYGIDDGDRAVSRG